MTIEKSSQGKSRIMEIDAAGISVKRVEIGGEVPYIVVGSYALMIQGEAQAQALVSAISTIAHELGWEVTPGIEEKRQARERQGMRVGDFRLQTNGPAEVKHG